MNIFQPDSYPGRCKNHRTINWYPEAKTVRCLDYEGTEHVCTFERLPEPIHVDMLGMRATITREPEPWVKPEVSP